MGDRQGIEENGLGDARKISRVSGLDYGVARVLCHRVRAEQVAQKAAATESARQARLMRRQKIARPHAR